MLNTIFVFAALSGLTSVALGAFAAHGLRGQLEAKLMNAFETGVTYQMQHSLALLAVGLCMAMWGRQGLLQYAGGFFMAGILLFSGSLYLLALTGWRWPGPVTPLGGVCLITGWGLFAAGLWQHARPL